MRNTMKNNRTFLEKLLDGAEVEWKPLSLVTEMQRGKTITAKSANEGNIPVISGGQKPAYYHNESNRDGKTITVAGSGAYAGYIMYWEEPIFVSDAFSIKTDESLLQIKYVYHFLLQNQQKIHAMKKGSGVPHVYPKDIGTLMIPIPPLSVQTEIVKILDALTALTSELTSELILRRKQYEYYRERLLSFDSLEQLNMGGAKKKLIDVAIIGTGSRNTNEAIENGIYPFFVRSQEPKKINEYEFDETAIITAGDGVGVGKVFHYISGKYALHQRAYRIVVTDKNLLPKFLFHYIRNNFTHYLKMTSVNSSVTSLRKPMFEKYPVFVPPLEEQHRIVSILDKFEALTNSITEGLPLAIEQSQKRYEYYRELLLNFS